MNNPYGNRLRKNKNLNQENIQEKSNAVYPLNQFIRDKIKMNNNSGNEKVEANRRGIYYANKNSNPLVTSYNITTYSNSKYNTNIINRINNHSLYDSNKQKIISLNNNNKHHHNFVQFISKNQRENKNNNYNYYNKLNKNKIVEPNKDMNRTYKNIKENNNENKNEKNDKELNSNKKFENEININFQKNKSNEKKLSNHNITYSNHFKNSKGKNTLDRRRINRSVKFGEILTAKVNNLIHRRNKKNNFNSLNSNTNYYYNYTEFNSSYENSHSKSKNKEYIYLKRNMTDNNYLTDDVKNNNVKQNNNKNDKFSSSNIKIQIFNSNECMNLNKRNRKYKINKNYIIKKNINKSITNVNSNINTEKLNNKIISQKTHDFLLPIKLNIQNKNKEKLSRIKKIIEKYSTYNTTFYQLEFPDKITLNKIINSAEKRSTKNVISYKNLPIFKKKKIKILSKEENKGEDDMIYENNFFANSPIYQTNINIKPRRVNKKIKDNNQIQSLVASYNLSINKDEGSKNKTLQKPYQKKSIFIKINDNVHEDNDDTMSLSYSKEQNISIQSKNRNFDRKNSFYPFLMENFSIEYNTIDKNLIINDKNQNNKSNMNDNDEDDDNFQLTKEIILLKKGLSKKTKLSNEIKQKLRQIKPQRIYKLCLLGNKGIYKKKISNYKTNFHSENIK